MLDCAIIADRSAVQSVGAKQNVVMFGEQTECSMGSKICSNIWNFYQ
jgi:hypothetical protein